MANPYGLPENDPLLTAAGSMTGMREANKRAADQQAKIAYEDHLARQEYNRARAAGTTGAGALTGGQILAALNNPNLPPYMREALVAQMDTQLGITPEQKAAMAAEEAAKNPPKAPKQEHGVLTPLGHVVGGAVGGAIETFGGLASLAGSGANYVAGQNAVGDALKTGGAAISEFAQGAQDFFSTEEGIREREAFFRNLQDPNKSTKDIISEIANNKAIVAGIVGGFLTPGLGAAKVFDKIGSMKKFAEIAEWAKKSEKGAKALSYAKPTAVAGTLSAAEGGSVGNEVYNFSIEQGATPEEASAAAQRAVMSGQNLGSIALGTIPIVEKIFGSVASKPGFWNRIWSVAKTGTGEALQEGYQERLQREAENIGKDRPVEEGTDRAQLIGTLLGGVSGAALQGGRQAFDAFTSEKKPDPNAPPPPGTLTGAAFIEDHLAKLPSINDQVKVILNSFNKDIAEGKITQANAVEKLTEKLKGTRRFNQDDMAAALPEFVNVKVAEAFGGAPPAAAGTATAAPGTATVPTTGAVNGVPVGAPAAAGAPTTTPVVTTGVGTVPEPAVAAAQATAATTGAAPPVATIAAQAQQAATAQEQLQATAAKAEAAPEVIATDVATAMFDDKNPDELGKTVAAGQQQADTLLREMDAQMEQGRVLTSRMRQEVQQYALRSALARGATPEVAQQYATEMAATVAIPTSPGMTPQRLQQEIMSAFQRADETIGQKYQLVSPGPQRMTYEDFRRRSTQQGLQSAQQMELPLASAAQTPASSGVNTQEQNAQRDLFSGNFRQLPAGDQQLRGEETAPAGYSAGPQMPRIGQQIRPGQELAPLGTEGVRQRPEYFDSAPIIEGEFREVPPELTRGDRNLLGFDTRPDMPGTSEPSLRPRPRADKTPRLTLQGRQSQELVAAYVQAIEENTPESLARAVEIADTMQEIAENGGDAQLQTPAPVPAPAEKKKRGKSSPKK